MREHKFKAWFQTREDTEQKYSGMYDVIAIDFGSRVIQVARASVFCRQIFSFDDVELLEWTGRKDKNGAEIFEGDLVAHPLCVKEPHNEREPCETFIGRIQYEEDKGQYFAVNTKRNGYVIVLSEAYKFEVIGNIYENPELLT